MIMIFGNKEKKVKKLRKKADKLGYDLIKRAEPMPKLMKCVCGHNRRKTIYNQDGSFYFECMSCKFKSEPAKTNRQCRINWNEAVYNTCGGN